MIKNPPKDASISLSELWPTERDYIARPDRHQYLRREKAQLDSCIFCSIYSQGVSKDSLCLYQSAYSLVVINKYPYNSGHLLILPKRHTGSFSDLSDIELSHTFKLLRQSSKILESVYSCKGLNIGCNQGAVAGAGLPNHLHWHIIPRWLGDTNFFPLIAETKLTLEEVRTTYDKLYPHFKKIQITI